ECQFATRTPAPVDADVAGGIEGFGAFAVGGHGITGEADVGLGIEAGDPQFEAGVFGEILATGGGGEQRDRRAAGDGKWGSERRGGSCQWGEWGPDGQGADGSGAGVEQP